VSLFATKANDPTGVFMDELPQDSSRRSENRAEQRASRRINTSQALNAWAPPAPGASYPGKAVKCHPVANIDAVPRPCGEGLRASEKYSFRG
jgi:hypothetical protein